MNDNECVQFLQWALPQLRMRWTGFRKVRAQVCKRIDRRMRQLHIKHTHAYKTYLAEHRQEWIVLDELSRITISRFYRDKSMFGFLTEHVLPVLAQNASARHESQLNVWSAGCASGEEAYTLSLIWLLQLKAHFADIKLSITATDASTEMIARAQQACYAYSSIKNLPSPWRELAFRQQQDSYYLKPEFHQPVRFMQQDIRQQMPSASFDLVLCRNLAFTYFDPLLQYQVLKQILQKLKPGGALVIGIHENLPAGADQFSVWSDKFKVYRNTINEQSCD
ncbi:CheR family methyltransferase [Kaarinaea lacus]